MAKAPRFKYTCNTCKGSFTAPRKATQARCVSCGSMATELVSSLTPLCSADEERVPQLAREEPETQTEAETPPQRKAPVPGPSEKSTDFVSTFACIDCAKKFPWNFTQRGNRTPVCSSCKSADVKEISPRASAIAVVKGKIPTVMTKSEMKRVRFIRRHWRMRCELKEYVDGLNGLLSRLGFSSPKIVQARNLMNELLAEVDRQQQLRLNDYDGMRVS